jgi:hypothetical protein
MEHHAGFGYGNHEDASFNLSKKITVHPGNNTLDVLSMMIGVQVYKFSSLHNITLTDIFHISITLSVCCVKNSVGKWLKSYLDLVIYLSISVEEKFVPCQ